MPLTAATLDEVAAVRHGFFTRAGGVSGGLYASLNCGYGSADDPDNVRTNRARAVGALGAETPGAGAPALVTVHQVHSADVVTVTQPWSPDAAPRADAMVTTTPGVILGVSTADCAPVLLADPAAGIVAAAHAGWRGALTGVIETTVAAMVAAGAAPERLVAAVGPCIAQVSYEVGPEFPAPFLQHDPTNRAFFAPAARADHWLFDLAGYVTQRLTRAGVAQPAVVGRDTYADDRDFFSYRRATHRGKPDYGRNLSAIRLVERR